MQILRCWLKDHVISFFCVEWFSVIFTKGEKFTVQLLQVRACYFFRVRTSLPPLNINQSSEVIEEKQTVEAHIINPYSSILDIFGS